MLMLDPTMIALFLIFDFYPISTPASRWKGLAGTWAAAA